MNLTYEITENGYKIFNNDTLWIVESNYLPFKGITLKESAENHIEYLIEQNEKAGRVEPLEDKINKVDLENHAQNEAIAEITMMITPSE